MTLSSAGLARDEQAPARSLRNKQWTAFSVFRERLQVALQEEYPDTTAGCVATTVSLDGSVPAHCPGQRSSEQSIGPLALRPIMGASLATSPFCHLGERIRLCRLLHHSDARRVRDNAQLPFRIWTPASAVSLCIPPAPAFAL